MTQARASASCCGSRWRAARARAASVITCLNLTGTMAIGRMTVIGSEYQIMYFLHLKCNIFYYYIFQCYEGLWRKFVSCDPLFLIYDFIKLNPRRDKSL